MPGKKIVKTLPLPDPYFCSRYRISPYKGCAHGCLYCDGRAEKYHLDGDFERDIEIRSSLPGELGPALDRLREKGFVSVGSGVTDVYQPLEAEEKLTRRIGEVLLEKEMPVLVATKSALALRDLDLWAELNRKARFILLVSFSTPEESLRRRFEPGASPLAERWEMVRRFRRAGCPVGILAMPLLPGLSDRPGESPLALPEGIDPVCLLPAPLTLRPGRQKELFCSGLRRFRPDLEGLYSSLYAEERASGAPRSPYVRDLYARFSRALADRRLSPLLPHRCWKGAVSSADEVFLLLSHMEILYAGCGVSTAPLSRAKKGYESWIREVRKDMNRRRSSGRAYREDFLRESSRNGTLAEIFENAKLGRFFREVLERNRCFDYENCRLI